MTSSSTHEVTLDQLTSDPYPTYARWRAEDPVHWFEPAQRYMVTKYADVMHVERNPELFKANEEGSLLTREMGHAFIRKDGEAHRLERTAVEPAMRPRLVKQQWGPAFEQNFADLIETFADDPSADLFSQLAGPYAARNLTTLLGLRQVSDTDLQIWSQAFIDGGGSNYGRLPEVSERARAASAAVDDAIDEVLPYLRAHPDQTVISCMAAAGLDLDQIRANVKVFVGGGLNEPRDALLTAIWAVLRDPVLRAEVEADPTLWSKVFEEGLRWIAPIGMYPRQVVADTELGGVKLSAGAKLGISLASANRDEDAFEHPDVFDIHRSRENPHAAFGGGPHFCLGTWVARTAIASIALPALWRRLPNLQLDPAGEVRIGGWAFRGLLSLPVLPNG